MNIELATLHDGGVMLVSDRPLPHVIRRVEFYRDERLFMLVYNTDQEDSELMHYEVPENMLYPIEKSPDVIIYSLFPQQEPIGYKVPLIKVGDVF